MPNPASKKRTIPQKIDADIAAIDALLATVGLEHGTRPFGGKIIRQPKILETSREELKLPLLKLSRRRAGSKGNVPAIVEVEAWKRLSWLAHGFSTRIGGASTVYGKEEMNLGFTDSDERLNVLANRASLVEAVCGRAKGSTPPALITAKQIHSNLIRRVTRTDAPAEPLSEATHRCDGLMTDEPGLLLAIQTADCVPILIVDPKKKAVAAFHAGWRGTLKRIVEIGVGRMRYEFGSKPEDLVAAIGPAIGQCCYSVGEEVVREFESQFVYGRELFREVYDSDPIRLKYPLLFLSQRAPGHSDLGPWLHLNLAEANRRQLLDAGVKAKQITMATECTCCHQERYFSHRGSHGFAGRMMSVIGITGK
jgi:hypothetical protein